MLPSTSPNYSIPKLSNLSRKISNPFIHLTLTTLHVKGTMVDLKEI